MRHMVMVGASSCPEMYCCLISFSGHGHITFLDQHYETIRELRAGNHKFSDKHEFHLINEKTGLIQVYQPVARDLRAYGASAEQQWIVNAVIQGTT
jgi:hypothetical protein